MKWASNARFLPRVLSNEGKTPLYMIFFVTSRCNLRCDHCFFWKELNIAKKELSLEEIEKVTKNMDPLLLLRMTGGEPFLRTDLPEIAGLFYKNAGMRNLGINTAGFFTKRIVESVKKILSQYPIDLDVVVSIDDFKDQHDSNRGVKGSFDNAVNTIHELKKLQKEYPNLVVTTVTTVMAKNQDRIDDIFEEIKRIGPDFMNANFIRGDSKNPSLKATRIENYMRFVNKINEYNSSKLIHNFYINSKVKNKLLSNTVYNTHVQGKHQGVTCVAADKMTVLYSEGDVHLCEMLNENIGNLRDYNYDFRKLWASENRKNIRNAMVKRKCFCTHECFMSASLLLDLKNFAKAFRPGFLLQA